MNFFGHAAVASWSSADATRTLGAMLPDFVGMASTHLGLLAPGPLADGVALHHRTDSVFHVLPTVAGLMRELATQLTDAGCARGPMRAASHLGIELLLDGELARAPAYRTAYLAALAAPITDRLDDAMHALIARLRTYGVPDDLRDPALAARRTVRAIAHRPRLAASADDAAVIARAFTAIQPRVQVAVDAIVRSLRAGLSDARPAP